MATRNGRTPKLEGFVKKQISVAQKRLHTLEEEAGRVIDGLRHRGNRSRRELEVLWQTFKPSDLLPLESPVVKQLGERAERASGMVREKLDRLQSRVVEATGVATQAQVKQLSRELSRLSKKVNALVGKKTASSAEPRQ